jgi:hypothetical protein
LLRNGTFPSIFGLISCVFLKQEIAMANRIRRWSAEDIQTLRRLAGKRSRAEIATELGRSASSLAVKAHVLRISLRLEERPVGDKQVAA